jgi:hypothetical protein
MNDQPNDSPGSGSEIILYETEDGRNRIEVRLQEETVWLTQNQMAELFQVDKSGISRHLKNIYESGELSPDSVAAKHATTAADGKTYQVEHYYLDAEAAAEARYLEDLKLSAQKLESERKKPSDQHEGRKKRKR